MKKYILMHRLRSYSPWLPRFRSFLHSHLRGSEEVRAATLHKEVDLFARQYNLTHVEKARLMQDMITLYCEPAGTGVFYIDHR